jgi:hypothetical protein
MRHVDLTRVAARSLIRPGATEVGERRSDRLTIGTCHHNRAVDNSKKRKAVEVPSRGAQSLSRTRQLEKTSNHQASTSSSRVVSRGDRADMRVSRDSQHVIRDLGRDTFLSRRSRPGARSCSLTMSLPGPAAGGSGSWCRGRCSSGTMSHGKEPVRAGLP